MCITCCCCCCLCITYDVLLYYNCITDYFCTEPLKPLVLHTPLSICHYYITLHYIKYCVLIFYDSANLCAAEAICPDVCPDVPCQHRYFFRFARLYWTYFDEIWGGDHYHLQMNCEIVLGTREQTIRIDVKSVLPRSEWFYKFHSIYDTLWTQRWRVHYTHAAAEASYDRVRSIHIHANHAGINNVFPQRRLLTLCMQFQIFYDYSCRVIGFLLFLN